jgi:peptidoglycan/LPS O-acetylase OafA/YrhL
MPANQRAPARGKHELRRNNLACTALAVLLGLGTGWLDLHTTEVTTTILALLAAGLLLGLLQPAAAWRWAVLIVLGLPVMAGVALLTDAQTAEPVRLDIRIVFIALLFALLGSYGGSLIRRIQRDRYRRSRRNMNAPEI